MVLPGYIVEAATRETEASDLETIKDWLEDGGDINDVDEDGCTILVAQYHRPMQRGKSSSRARN